MRLKIIFAPLVFLVSGVIAIWYIWPAVQEIQIRIKDLNKSKEILSSTLERKENAEVLRGILDKNKEKEDFIKSYLPENKSEERIVDGLNFLATNSGLSLVNFSAEEEKAAVGQAVQENISGANPTIINNSSNNQTGISNNVSKISPKVRFVTVKASISGKYENIKIFLSQIHKMEILNKVTSLSINKVAAGNESQGEEKVASDILIANIEMKFGYLPQISEEGGSSSPIFSKSNMDFSPYEKLKDMIVKNIPALDEGQKGKTNPFLP